MDTVQIRCLVESGLAGLTGALALMTLLQRTWIEALFGADPDHGSGIVEWSLVAVLLVLSMVLSLSACRDWRKAVFLVGRRPQ